MNSRFRLSEEDFANVKHLTIACCNDGYLLPEDLDHLVRIVANYVPSHNVAIATLTALRQMKKGRYGSTVIRILGRFRNAQT